MHVTARVTLLGAISLLAAACGGGGSGNSYEIGPGVFVTAQDAFVVQYFQQNPPGSPSDVPSDATASTCSPSGYTVMVEYSLNPNLDDISTACNLATQAAAP